MIICSWTAFLASFSMLLCAVAQYRHQVGEWPISAFPSRKLAQNGLYLLWRHPIYLFYTFSLFFSAVLLGSGSMLLLVLPAFVVTMILYANCEDRSLEKRFGSCIDGYIRRTGAFIPRLQMLLRLPLLVITSAFLRVRVKYRNRVPLEGPLFVVASHRSYLDPLFMATAVQRHINFVMTAQLLRNRLLALFFKHLGCIPRRRYLKDTGCIRRMIREIGDCGIIGIFPEGERSWTGDLGNLKEECMRFLLRFRDVPILPLRIEGNYAIWPRWRRRPSHGEIRITVLPAFRPSADDTPQTLSTKLLEYIQPDDSGLETGNSTQCTGIGRVLYRCPVCMVNLPLFDDAGSSFECHSCATVFILDASLKLRFNSDNESVRLSISEAYSRIRITCFDDVSNCMFLKEQDIHFQLMMASERILAGCSNVAVVQERSEGSFEESGRGQVLLTDYRIILPGVPGFGIPLSEITSVTTEGCRRLQIYNSDSNMLYQLNFLMHSVLLWQDILVLAIEASTGRTPNRS
ncbi:MAG: 1-acyl-sn-glycerol-3-phosphate acyltransferase [Candidatus Aegiribacteria sp.]|nr:1-acyl-sn-glycerol-3-phosphate acyltransferase [Candidatus Aegiribacteria sp.]